MPFFTYRTLNGEQGTIEALHVSEAKEKLHRRGLLILQIKPHKNRTLRLSLRDRQVIMRELARLLQAGLPLYESLRLLEEKYRGHRAHLLFLNLSEQVRTGIPLSRALAAHPKLFSVMETSLISNAEKTGSLAAAFRELASLLQRQVQIRKQLVGALLYPALLGTFCLFVMGLLLFYVIPSLQDLFEGRELNPLTHFVLALSRGAIACKASLILIFITLVGGAVGSLYHPKSKRFIIRLTAQLPLIRTLWAKASLLRFCRAASTLLEGGLPALHAFREARPLLHHPILEELVLKAEQALQQGALFYQPFEGHPLVPPLVPRLFALAQQAGNLPFMMRQIAEIYEDDLDQTVAHVTAVAQPILLLVLGAIVGLVLLAVLIPLTDVGSFLN